MPSHGPSRVAADAANASSLWKRLRAGEVSLAIRHENLEDKIYAALRLLIVERRMLPGERIPVDALAREMGVSRTPVLNALKRLGQERVVVFHSRRGVFVRRFTKQEMATLFAVREVLEGLAARLAAARIARAEVQRFRGAFRGLDSAPPAVRRYLECDRGFHARLLEIAGNEPLTAAMHSLNMMLFAWQDGLVRPPADTLPEHLMILKALEQRDGDASESAMRLHIRRSLEQLQRDAEQDKEEERPDTPGRVRGVTRGDQNGRRRSGERRGS
jgi:GntR family transcriptional regulator, rspAB operon transcriptional repressor